jgi:hypothetical protein
MGGTRNQNRETYLHDLELPLDLVIIGILLDPALQALNLGRL